MAERNIQEALHRREINSVRGYRAQTGGGSPIPDAGPLDPNFVIEDPKLKDRFGKIKFPDFFHVPNETATLTFDSQGNNTDVSVTYFDSAYSNNEVEVSGTFDDSEPLESMLDGSPIR